jgi:hypothetical protein
MRILYYEEMTILIYVYVCVYVLYEVCVCGRMCDYGKTFIIIIIIILWRGESFETAGVMVNSWHNQRYVL